MFRYDNSIKVHRLWWNNHNYHQLAVNYCLIQPRTVNGAQGYCGAKLQRLLRPFSYFDRPMQCCRKQQIINEWEYILDSGIYLLIFKTSKMSSYSLYYKSVVRTAIVWVNKKSSWFHSCEIWWRDNVRTCVFYIPWVENVIGFELISP